MRFQLLKIEGTNKAFLRRIQSVWLESEAQEININNQECNLGQAGCYTSKVSAWFVEP